MGKVVKVGKWWLEGDEGGKGVVGIRGRWERGGCKVEKVEKGWYEGGEGRKGVVGRQ